MAPTGPLFGTDGVRGLANGGVLTAELALGLGAAAARVLVDHGEFTRRRPLA
ncbi:MAG: phosphoglucosamine mutase, partial [Nocardioides kribbensis]